MYMSSVLRINAGQIRQLIDITYFSSYQKSKRDDNELSKIV